MQNSNICPVCNTSFSRRDALLRHKKNKHSEITENYPPGIPFETSKELSIMTPLNRPQFKFQHPCSVVLTGPSGSGKSVLTKKILCQSFIQPPPQRIIWCYGQYQPLYDNVKKHVPGVEFVKGIPDFIEHDTYLDTSVRNCIILDDFMGDAKKDERVANLFTKGVHHRNLTVLSISLKTCFHKDKHLQRYKFEYQIFGVVQQPGGQNTSSQSRSTHLSYQ